MDKKKKKDVEISNEVSTNDYQTHSIMGNHVRDLIRNDLGKIEKQPGKPEDPLKEGKKE